MTDFVNEIPKIKYEGQESENDYFECLLRIQD